MWVKVHVAVDPVGDRLLRLPAPMVLLQIDGVSRLDADVWVESEHLPPHPVAPDGTLRYVADYKYETLVVWSDPNRGTALTLFGVWTARPGELVADKWAEGVVSVGEVR